MFAIIDVETTGMTARFDRITEIAIILHDGQRVVDSFTTLLNPERPIPATITQVTGIHDALVADAPKFYEVARRIVEVTADAIFVAHNVSFDYNFVREEFNRLGYNFQRRQLCTVRMARKAFPGLASYSLTNLKRHFGIRAARSHRAMDDALATVQVFERILAVQPVGISPKKALQLAMRDARLPDGINLDQIEALPDTCGIYYMYDADQNVLYVGKSLNIRKRIIEHFADKTKKGEQLRKAVAGFSFEVTGSELAALLLESAEIKRLQPPVNRAQRLRLYPYAIYAYTDENAYKCLVFGKNTAKNAKKWKVVSQYAKLDHARAHLTSVVRHYELCYRLTHLDASEHACFHYSIRQCKGACVGHESPGSYNERVEMAILHMDKHLEGSFLIIDEGRHPDEKTVFGVRNGHFAGFGYFDTHDMPEHPDLYFDQFRFRNNDDPEAARIIRGSVTKKGKLKIIPIT